MTFKSEMDFGLDNFQQPKKLNAKDSIAQVIINLLLMRPGNMPSLPHIGININQYLYVLEEDLDADKLKEDIYSQCSELLSYISLGEVKVFIAPHEGENLLIISVPISGLTEEEETLFLGFKQDKSNDILFNYEFENKLVNF